MDLGLKGKRFLIGGGSRGLGHAIAQVLADEGASVLLMSRDEASLQKAAAKIGASASYVAVDISSPGAVETLSNAVDDKLGGLDGILINAGGPPPGEVLGVTDEQWVQSFELLIGGPIRCSSSRHRRSGNRFRIWTPRMCCVRVSRPWPRCWRGSSGRKFGSIAWRRAASIPTACAPSTRGGPKHRE